MEQKRGLNPGRDWVLRYSICPATEVTVGVVGVKRVFWSCDREGWHDGAHHARQRDGSELFWSTGRGVARTPDHDPGDAASQSVDAPAPEQPSTGLREAAQAVVDAAKPLNTPLEWASDNRARIIVNEDHFDALMDAVDALNRAALAAPREAAPLDADRLARARHWFHEAIEQNLTVGDPFTKRERIHAAIDNGFDNLFAAPDPAPLSSADLDDIERHRMFADMVAAWQRTGEPEWLRDTVRVLIGTAEHESAPREAAPLDLYRCPECGITAKQLSEMCGHHLRDMAPIAFSDPAPLDVSRLARAVHRTHNTMDDNLCDSVGEGIWGDSEYAAAIAAAYAEAGGPLQDPGDHFAYPEEGGQR